MYVRRAVDEEGEVLEVLVQHRRDKAAVCKLMRKLLEKHGFAPTQVTTDKLRPYGAAFRQLGLTARFASSTCRLSFCDKAPRSGDQAGANTDGTLNLV